jgi:hypothetical protein
LTVVEVIAPAKRSSIPVWVCEYPEQEFKTREGAQCKRVDTLATIKIEKVEEDRRRLHIKPSKLALEG